MALEVNKHGLVPQHSKVSDAEREKILKKFNISVNKLPKILKNDPAIVELKLKTGDLIKVERISKTAGTSTYYRVVIDGE